MKRLMLSVALAFTCVTVAAAQVAPPQLVPPVPIPDLCASATGCGITFTNSTVLANLQEIQADVYKMQTLYSQLQQLQQQVQQLKAETAQLSGMSFSSWSTFGQGSLGQTNGGSIGAMLFGQANDDILSLQNLEALAPSVQGATGAAELNAGLTANVAGTLQQQMALQGTGAVTTYDFMQSTPSIASGIFDLNEPASAGWENL